MTNSARRFRHFARFVELSNAGARGLGYADTGAMWRSGYDMPPDEFAALTDKLWNEVKPLYDQLHCCTRAKLNEKHGNSVQPATGPIRADLLGAACRQAGWTGPLHRCSFYDNKEVGRRLNAMLEMGKSRPWPDALEAFTGTREMSGRPLLAYFAPLQGWLEQQNRGKQCGW